MEFPELDRVQKDLNDSEKMASIRSNLYCNFCGASVNQSLDDFAYCISKCNNCIVDIVSFGEWNAIGYLLFLSHLSRVGGLEDLHPIQRRSLHHAFWGEDEDSD